jgi:hypothetical protein
MLLRDMVLKIDPVVRCAAIYFLPPACPFPERFEPLAKRVRRDDKASLVACALISYPKYLSRTREIKPDEEVLGLV